MATKKERRLSVRMDRDPELLAWVENVAKESRLPPSWVVRWALDEVRTRGLSPLGAAPHRKTVKP